MVDDLIVDDKDKPSTEKPGTEVLQDEPPVRRDEVALTRPFLDRRDTTVGREHDAVLLTGQGVHADVRSDRSTQGRVPD